MMTSQSTDIALMSLVLPADLTPYLDRIRSECPPHSNLPERLLTGEAAALRLSANDALLIVQIGPNVDTHKAFWIAGLIGAFGFHPKRNLATMRVILGRCEELATETHCRDLCVDARGRAMWKRHILPLFGFEPFDMPDRSIMRKILQWA